MNILIPDSWLREYLQTKATPKQIKEYLSLCGPSVERIHIVSKEVIYDIEVTSNRPDSMSVFGIAREAAAILPRFGIPAKLTNNPYIIKNRSIYSGNKQLNIKTDFTLNPRWTSIVIDNVTVKKSPLWLQKKLEATGIRALNTVIDITNFLMRVYGQPAHAFDYDQIKGQKMILRPAKKGEKVTTLDGKTHRLPGGDIVIEDGSGELIDLCGIMGAQNSSIRDKTNTVVLFLQTYDPAQIRKTSMALSHRTEASSLFEKGIDSELVLPAIIHGIELMKELTGGNVASKLYDLYNHPYQSYSISLKRQKTEDYIGKQLSDKEIKDILTSLGFRTGTTTDTITVTVPSFRRDIMIDVDVIEELARLYGYHNIVPTLPDTPPPMTSSDPTLVWEEEIKTRLRDWGYTETYTYSMISEECMDIFKLDKRVAYKISNPLSSEWVYMRPSLIPSMLTSIAGNLAYEDDLTLFELSLVYKYRSGQLPEEKPYLIVSWTGEMFYKAKGLAEAIFSIMGIANPEPKTSNDTLYSSTQVAFGKYGSIGYVHQDLLDALHIKTPVTILDLDFSALVSDSQPTRSYNLVPKYPPAHEDISFTLPSKSPIGPIIEAIGNCDSLIAHVSLLDSYGDSRTFHITYLSKTKNLTSKDLQPIRKKIIALTQKSFGAKLRGSW